MRLRQIALVAEDLDARTRDVADLLGLQAGYADPGVGAYGLENVVMPVGDTFLEIVSPKQDGTTAGRLLEKRGGDGGYMVILQVEDFAAAYVRIKDKGVRIVSERHGDCYDFAHMHPKDIGGAIVSVDEMRPPEHWEWGGPDWKGLVDTSVTTGIVGVEIQSSDPAAMAARWADVLGLSAATSDRKGEIALDGGLIRFVEDRDGRGDGVSALMVKVADAGAFMARAQRLGALDADGVATACGTRIYPIA
jgi:catechol 2,3-dioxygenase-like lactoylglutathione lyase family enzyme